jgi:hypothetical protein
MFNIMRIRIFCDKDSKKYYINVVNVVGVLSESKD